MLFNSFSFLIFFPVTVTLFYTLPHRFRWILLLLASCLFYMAFIPKYILILMFTIIVDYAVALNLERLDDQQKKKAILLISLIANIGVLVAFKYSIFLEANLSLLCGFLGLRYEYNPANAWALPIGLSFHTFQAMGYTIDVYNGNMKAERHLGIFALYVLYFPQLVAGPIERPQNLLHQFHEEKYFDCDLVLNGLKLMAWGMFKKVVIADRISSMVDPIFDHPQGHGGLSLTVATVLFAYQIYCDFSGYSDIAIGASQVMGIRLMTNFDRPYWSASIAEFWRRWHISLSTWFRDYVYFPLGGNRVSKNRWYLNLLIVFLVSGIWHGANYTFIVWGLLHGIYMIGGAVLQPARARVCEVSGLSKHTGLLHPVNIVFTFAMVCLGWIFFRAQTLTDALYIVGHLGQGWNALSRSSIENQLMLGSPVNFIIAVAAIAYAETIEHIHRNNGLRSLFQGHNAVARWSMYYSIVLGILLVGVWGTKAFIYFQF